jgi:hypothetical protein
MDSELDEQIVSRLRRLEATASPSAPGFDYDGMLERHGAAEARSRRRTRVARGTAYALGVALLAVSVWRLDASRIGQGKAFTSEETIAEVSAPRRSMEPRIVRADTYLAVVALEDHIANLDDALNYARVAGAQAEVTRLERTRAELLDSYRRVRYADLVSANF